MLNHRIILATDTDFIGRITIEALPTLRVVDIIKKEKIIAKAVCDALYTLAIQNAIIDIEEDKEFKTERETIL